MNAKNLEKMTERAPSSTDEHGLPTVSVGIRFHRLDHAPLLERCLNCVAAQLGVRVNLLLAVQGFSVEQVARVNALTARSFFGSDFNFEILNVPNPEAKDMRSALLNEILDCHYEIGNTDYLAFIDYDDVWFQYALINLIEPLRVGSFVLSYADVHCADVLFDSGQVYICDVRDVFEIKRRTKRDLLQDNFLPLHSYMFHTGRIEREVLRYDEKLSRLEDYDVLLKVARRYPVSGLHRKRLIGLYNFYSTQGEGINTSRNIFHTPEGEGFDEAWAAARRTIIARHSGKSWREFAGEEWEA